MDLRNANIIVTGGAKGMGRHFAEAAAKAGAKVFVGDVDENGLAELPEPIGHAHLDVSSAESRKAFLSQASASMGDGERVNQQCRHFARRSLGKERPPERRYISPR